VDYLKRRVGKVGFGGWGVECKKGRAGAVDV
jgi:hypothetical protein